MQLAGGVGVSWFMCDRVTGKSGSASLGWLTFSAIQGIFIPGDQAVNDDGLPRCGFHRGRRTLAVLGAPATLCVICITQ